jgi:Tfp pilus assembly protein PilF
MTYSRAIWRALWIAVCLSGLACATPNPNKPRLQTAEELREMGEKFLAGGDTSTALQYLTQSHSKKPNDPATLYDLGMVYDTKQLQTEALQYFQEAIKLKPDYSEAHNAIGKIYAEQGNSAEAMQAFQKALSNPFYATPQYPLFNMGLLHEKEGQWAAALAMYQRAVQANKSYAPTYYRMGYVLEKLGRAGEARQAYAQAVQLNPNLAEAHLAFARLSYQAGDYENAHFSFGRVLRLAPNTPMATEAEKYLQSLQRVMGLQ